MKKYLIIALSLAFVLGAVLPVLALTPPGTQALNLLNQTGTEAFGSQPKELPQIIALIVNVLLGLLGVIFLVLIVYAGFLWMVAREDEKKTTDALHIIKNGVIGLIITLAAYAISNFVINALVNAL